MPRLNFKIDFVSQELHGAPLPVEVRGVDSRILRQALSTQTIDLPAGEYFVSCSLPAGQELLSRVTVPAAGTTVRLEPTPEQRSPHEAHELIHFTQGRRRSGTGLLEAMGMPNRFSAPAPLVRVFDGNPFAGHMRQVDAATRLLRSGASSPPVHRLDLQSTGCVVVQLWQARRAPRNVALASFGGSNAMVMISEFADGSHRIEAHLGRSEADLLLRYARQGDFRNAQMLAQQGELAAQDLLYNKMADPVAAAAAACALLRAGNLEKLRLDWTENLAGLFQWLPDGAALHGEHLARRGLHEPAIKMLLETTKRGLPVLTDAFFYVFERLKLYTVMPSLQIDRSQIENAISALKPFAAAIDPNQPITTYPGLDPNDPDAVAPALRPMSAEAIELRPF